MNLKQSLAALTGLTVALQFAAAGNITAGHLERTPPAEKPITPLKEDATCGKLVEGTPTTKFFVVGPNKELADVVVMLKGDSLKGKSTGTRQRPRFWIRKAANISRRF